VTGNGYTKQLHYRPIRLADGSTGAQYVSQLAYSNSGVVANSGQFTTATLDTTQSDLVTLTFNVAITDAVTPQVIYGRADAVVGQGLGRKLIGGGFCRLSYFQFGRTKRGGFSQLDGTLREIRSCLSIGLEHGAQGDPATGILSGIVKHSSPSLLF